MINGCLVLNKYDDQIIHQERNVIFNITEKTSFQCIDINIGWISKMSIVQSIEQFQ